MIRVSEYPRKSETLKAILNIRTHPGAVTALLLVYHCIIQPGTGEAAERSITNPPGL
jgi:hypothetical protein